MSRRVSWYQIKKIEPGCDDDFVAFLIQQMVGTSVQVPGSTDKLFIHRAWSNNGWILAEAERYGLGEPEPQLNSAQEEPPTDYRLFKS